MTTHGTPDGKSSVGDDLIEAFAKMSEYLRGRAGIECYEIADEEFRSVNTNKTNFPTDPAEGE